MKIGKDEIGAIGIIGLILVLLGMFLLVDNLLSGGFLLILLMGSIMLVSGSGMYYSDLINHRKKAEQTSY